MAAIRLHESKPAVTSLTSELLAVGVHSYDPSNAIDELLDSGFSFLSQPERTFTAEFIHQAGRRARVIYQRKTYVTQIRAAELGVSEICQARKFSASWNAPLFPEIAVLEVAGPLKRHEQASAKIQKPRAKSRISTARPERSACPGPGVTA